MRPPYIFRFTFSLFSIFLLFTSVHSQVTGKIGGYVRDKETKQPLPGVNVIVNETQLGAATASDGYFYIINIPPGVYTITVRMIGYKTVTVKNVRVVVGQTTKLNIEMEQTFLQMEEVVVEAERPLIQKDLTSKVSTFSYEEIKNMPAEDMTRVLALQSNVSILTNTPYAKAGYNIRGIEDIRMRGGRNNEIGLYIDGMKVGNPIFGGWATRINNNAINQMSVAAGGFSPEYGNSLSGVINVTTREGGQRYSGQIEYSSSIPFGIREIAPDEGKARNYHDLQFSFGGPTKILRRLTFFVSGDVSLSASEVYQADQYTWNDHPKVKSGELPTSEVLFQDFIVDGKMDSITLTELRSVLTPNPVGGKRRWINPLDTWKGWHGFGWDHSFDVLGKLTYRFNPNMKLSISTSFFQRYSQSNAYHAGYYYHIPGKWYNIDTNPEDLRENIDRLLVDKVTGEKIYLPAGAPFPDSLDQYEIWHRNRSGMGARPIRFQRSHFLNMIWNHALSASTFYTIRLQRFFESRIVRMLNDYDQKYRKWFGMKNPFAPPWDNILQKDQYAHRNVYGVRDPWEGYFRIRYDNNYFSGDSSYTYDFRIDATSQVSRHNQVKTGLEFIYREVFRHDDQSSSGVSEYPTVYTMYPKEGAFYILDKIEYDNIIVNLGARLDWANAGGEMWSDPLAPLAMQDPESPGLEYAGWVRAKDKYKISPRIGIAYPLTDKSVIHFNFGHFYQHSNYRDLYRSINVREVSMMRGTLVGNPSLEPEKSVQYEFGWQQQIGDLYGINVAIWTKETTNQVGSVWVPAYSDPLGINPYSYSVFLNNNFGSARGVDVTIQKRYSHYLSGTLNYTWSRARVLKQTSWDGYWDGDTKQTMPKREVRASWDQPHSIRVHLNFSIPDGQGPTIFGKKPFSNFGLNVIYFGESGRVYTPYMGQGGFIEKENSARWPFWHQFDLRAYKNIKSGPITFSFFVQVRNLFDRKNVLTGYARTGSPTDPGGAYPDISATRMDGISFNNFGPRRSINFGIRLLY